MNKLKNESIEKYYQLMF